MAGDLREVSGEHGTAVRVDLDLADGGQSGAFQPEVQTTDTGEQGQHVQAHQAVSLRVWLMWRRELLAHVAGHVVLSGERSMSWLGVGRYGPQWAGRVGH
jgi:hypothetical protein